MIRVEFLIEKNSKYENAKKIIHAPAVAWDCTELHGIISRTGGAGNMQRYAIIVEQFLRR